MGLTNRPSTSRTSSSPSSATTDVSELLAPKSESSTMVIRLPSQVSRGVKTSTTHRTASVPNRRILAKLPAGCSPDDPESTTATSSNSNSKQGTTTFDLFVSLLLLLSNPIFH